MSNARRVLLFGGSGQLGSEIARAWAEYDVVAPSSAEVNVEDRDAVERAIEAARPAIVLNCTAYNRVDDAETDPAPAFALNAVAVAEMAQSCAARDLTFVTVSTDYVFDGAANRPYTEDDEPNPLNAYGRSKRAGETAVEALASRAYVVRTCGVYGRRPSSSKGYTFVRRVIAQARAGEPVRVVRDQTVSPTYAADLAAALRRLVEADAPYGVYHAANEGAVTWYDFAMEALRQAGVDAEIEAISFRDWPSRARRPAFSALENAKLHTLGIALPGWREAIEAYLHAVD